MTDHSTLERRLRDAADPAVWGDVSGDAWQQNELRVAADAARRNGRLARVVATAAAAALVIGGGVYVANELGGSSLAPAGPKDQDPFEPENVVGKTVVLERYQVNGATVAHSAFLTRIGGKGLSFCDLYRGPDTETSSSGGGSCTASSADPSDPKVNAFAFMTSTDSPELKGVTGAVERRVASVKAWVGDSAQARDVALHSLGVDGLRAFGITILGQQAPVLRIAAYDDDGAVLQIFDAPNYIGAEWLPDDDTCAKVTPVPATGDPAALGPFEKIEIATSSVRISGTAGPADICVPAPKGKPISTGRQGQFVVAVTAPEVTEVRYQVAGEPKKTVTPTHYPGTAWGVVLIFTEHPKAQVTVDPRSADGSVLSPKHYRLPTD